MRSNNLISPLIVFVGISGLVLGSAGYTLHAGIEKHSNYELVSNLLKPESSPVVIAQNSDNTTQILGASSDQVNNMNSEIMMQPATNSIVNYMNELGMDYNYKSRVRLAGELGIENYTGTSDQNKLLIQKL